MITYHHSACQFLGDLAHQGTNKNDQETIIIR